MNDQTMGDEMITVAELAAFTKLKPATIRRQAHLGKIPAYRIGSDLRFRKDEIEAWLARQAQCMVILPPLVASQIKDMDIPEGARFYRPGEVINGTTLPVAILTARRKDADNFVLRFRGLVIAGGQMILETA